MHTHIHTCTRTSTRTHTHAPLTSTRTQAHTYTHLVGTSKDRRASWQGRRLRQKDGGGGDGDGGQKHSGECTNLEGRSKPLNAFGKLSTHKILTGWARAVDECLNSCLQGAVSSQVVGGCFHGGSGKLWGRNGGGDGVVDLNSRQDAARPLWWTTERRRGRSSKKVSRAVQLCPHDTICHLCEWEGGRARAAVAYLAFGRLSSPRYATSTCSSL